MKRLLICLAVALAGCGSPTSPSPTGTHIVLARVSGTCPDVLSAWIDVQPGGYVNGTWTLDQDPGLAIRLTFITDGSGLYQVSLWRMGTAQCTGRYARQ